MSNHPNPEIAVLIGKGYVIAAETESTVTLHKSKNINHGLHLALTVLTLLLWSPVWIIKTILTSPRTVTVQRYLGAAVSEASK